MRDLSALKYVLVDYKVRIDYLDDVDGVLIEHGLAEMWKIYERGIICQEK